MKLFRYLSFSLLAISFVSLCGCNNTQSAVALNDKISDANDVNYPAMWTSGQYDSFRVVVTDGPYRVKESSLKLLSKVMDEQAGLQFETIGGGQTGLKPDAAANDEDILAAALKQIPSGDTPVLVIIVVNGIKHQKDEYEPKGFIVYHRSYLMNIAKKHHIELPGKMSEEDRFIAIMVLNRAKNLTCLFEDRVLVHEVGHWLGIPERKFHADGGHCANVRCLMFTGKWDAMTAMRALGANMFTGPPRQYCSDCEEELMEMRQLRQVNKERLQTDSK